jgi:hypothetical protein
MKKRFSMGWLWLVLWVLSACNAPESPIEVIDEPSSVITFEIMGLETIMVSHPIEEDLNAFELLQVSLETENIHLKYSESEFGIFIEEIASLKPLYGSYIMISLNGESISVGIADAPFEDEDTFTFQIEYWDQASKDRHHAIQSFLNTEAEIYLKAGSFEVFTAYDGWGLTPDVTYQPLSDTMADQIRSILILRSLDQDVTAHQAELAMNYQVEYTFSAGLGLLSLMGTDAYLEAKTEFIGSLDFLDVTNGWLDDLSMTIIALGDETPPDIITAFKSRVFENLNAPSLAHAIMALVVLEEDPYTVLDENGVSLVEHLLSLQLENGGFIYDESSAPTDTRQFSSPQSFLALVVLDRFISQSPVLPYRP